MKKISAKRLEKLRSNFERYERGDWHNPAMRDQYIAMMKKD